VKYWKFVSTQMEICFSKYVNYSTTLILHSCILHFLHFYALFVQFQPNAYKNNVSPILCHFEAVPPKIQNLGFTVYGWTNIK